MGGQEAGFIMVMNPGGLSNYGCRWTERGGRGEGVGGWRQAGGGILS